MKKIPKNIFLLILILALNIVVAGAYYFFYYQITAINKKVSEVAAEIDVQTAQKSDDRALKSILESTKEDREKIDGYLLTDDDYVSFIERIEALGALSRTQVVTSSVNVDDSGASKTTGFLTLRINVLGTFENTMHFVSLVENVPHQVWINQLRTNMTSSAEAGSKAREWQTEFELRVLKLKK